MEKELVNRVAKSGIQTLSLEIFAPKDPVFEMDLAAFLFRGLVLREKEFRSELRKLDWQQYRDAHLVVNCSTDAIVPMWAYMLIASHAGPVAKSLYAGSKAQFLTDYMCKRMDARLIPETFRDKRVVIKGCGDFSVPAGVFMHATNKLIPQVKSLMYGEPCSTVPIFKQKTVSQPK